MSRRTASKLSSVTMSPAASASSQRATSVSWSAKTGITTMRQMSQPRVKSKRKPILPGGKLQPLFKDGTASAKSRNVQNSEQFPVLPQISSDLMKNASECDVFSGSLTDLPEPEPTDVSVYLCYCVTEMRAEVDALMTTALPQLQSFCADLGLAFQLVDPNWRERNSPEVSKYRSPKHNRVLAECQRSSLGPNFVLLLGETCGQSMIVSEMTETEFEILDEVISRNCIANGHLLKGCYVRDDNIDPPAFKIKASPEWGEDPSNLIRLLQLASVAARDVGKLTDDVIKKYYTSALEEDVTNGVVGIQSPRNCCLGYRRELQPLHSSVASAAPRTGTTQKDKSSGQGQLNGEVKGQVTDGDENPGRAQSLWKNVEKYLSSTNSRSYFVKSEANGVVDEETDGIGGGEGFRSYLRELCADFVADVKELVLQSVVRHSSHLVRSLETHVRLETLHHLRICKNKSRSFHGQSELLEAVRSFLRDSSRNSQPFIIHGSSGCGKSAVVASAARTCWDWFSGECVTVVRFLGTTVASGNIHDTVTGIVTQICLAYGLEIPDEVEGFGTLYKALSTFRATLDTISKNHAHTRPLIIFLDGIDQFRPYSECLEALWAVKNLPTNVHVVLSSIKEYGSANFFGALVTLLTSPGCMAEVKAIRSNEANGFIQDHLRRKHRKLLEEQEKAVLSAAAGANNLPLYLNSIAHEAARWESTSRDPVLPSTAADALMSVLDSLEKEFGISVVRYFASYLTVSHLGIIFEEMTDLLSSNKEVVKELCSLGILSTDGVPTFPVAMVAALKHRVEEFVEARLVFGRQGFGWSHRVFRRAVAERYNIVVDGAADEQLQEDVANFTLMLHEHFSNIYITEEDRSSRLSNLVVTSSSGHSFTKHGKAIQCASALVLSVDDAFRSNRLVHHLRVLLPIEGLTRIKKCVIFDFRWLQSRLFCSGLTYTILRDVLSVYTLSKHLINESVIEDTCSDIEVVYEFLQLTLKHISKDPSVLAAEILGRLREVSKLHSSVGQLVKQAEEWLQTTYRRMLFPLRSVWTQPGSLVRHCLTGPTHFLGYLRDGEIAVLFSAKHGIDVWRLQSGELLHRFGVSKEQSLEGILAGHSSEFIILTRYSHVNRQTGFDVWSTETGVRLLSSNFEREFEAVALDEDDQLMVVATLVQSSEHTKDLERCILGIAVLTKEVVFRLPTGKLHADGGVGRLMFVRNIKRETDSIVSFGRSPSRDLGFWDLETGALDFSLDLGCTPSHVCLNTDHKVLVCGSSVSGALVIVNLARGTIDQKIEGGDDYIDLTDIDTLGDDIFVTNPKSGIVILSISQGTSRKVVNTDVPSQAIPTKLLVTGKSERLIFVGYDTGAIYVFDISSSGSKLGTLSGHKGRVNSLSLTRHGLLLSAAEDGSALVWNYRSLLEDRPEDVGEEEGGDDVKLVEERGVVAAAGNGNVECFVVTSDEQRVIMGSGSGSIQIWDIKSGELMKTMPGTGDSGIDHLSLARNEQLLIGHCTLEQLPNVRVLRVWDLEKSDVVQLEGEADDHVMIYCSAVTPSGDRLVTIRPCKDNGQIGIVLGIYDLTKMNSLSNLVCNINGTMDARNLRIVGFSSRSPQTVTMATLADKANRKSAKSLFLVLNYFPKVNMSFFFTFTICGDAADEISMDSHDPLHVDTTSPECSAVGPNEVCVTGSTRGQLLRWNVRTQVVDGDFVDRSTKKRKKEDSKEGGRFAHEGPVTCVAVDFKKGVIVSGGRDHKVKVWSLSGRELMTTFAGHQESILCVNFCAAQSLVVSTSTDETLCVLKLGKSAEKLCSFPSHGEVRSVVMTTDKHRVVALLRTMSGSQLLLLRSINF